MSNTIPYVNSLSPYEMKKSLPEAYYITRFGCWILAIIFAHIDKKSIIFCRDLGEIYI